MFNFALPHFTTIVIYRRNDNSFVCWQSCLPMVLPSLPLFVLSISNPALVGIQNVKKKMSL